MENNLSEKWRAESQAMVDNAIANSQQSGNKVHVSIDSVGAIKALVFGKEGIVSVEPCYDDEVSGKYAHRLAYPDEKKLKQIFSEKTGIADISYDDDKFIEFVIEEIKEQKNGAEWNGVMWDNTYSRYKDILYSSMQEAVSAMWSEDVFCGKRKEKSDLTQKADKKRDANETPDFMSNLSDQVKTQEEIAAGIGIGDDNNEVSKVGESQDRSEI